MTWPELPTPDQERELHRRLLAGDPVASADVAEAYLDRVIAHLRNKAARIRDEHHLFEAARRAWETLVKDPASFKPERSRSSQPLFSFLCQAAECDLKNVIAGEQRHWNKRKAEVGVELDDLAGKSSWPADDPAHLVMVREELAIVERSVLEPCLQDLSDDERQAVQMMMDGVRETTEYAKVLGLAHLAEDEQEHLVNKFKDKIKKRLKRAGEQHGEPS